MQKRSFFNKKPYLCGQIDLMDLIIHVHLDLKHFINEEGFACT